MTDIKAGDFVKWAKSGGTAKGKVISVHSNSTVPHTNPRVQGTPEDPAVKVQVHEKAEEGGYHPTRKHVAVPSSALLRIDPLPPPKGSNPAMAFPPGANGGGVPAIGAASGMRRAGTEHRATPIEVRDASVVQDDGTTLYQFWARVVGYDLEDTYGTDFRMGVFKSYLDSHPNRPTLCFGHGGSFAGIGAVLGHRVDWREDATGCDVLFAFDDFDAVPNAKQAWAQLMSGTFDSFSVGFIRREDSVAADGGVVSILQADLPEVSIVIEPSNPGTGLLAMSGQRSTPADAAASVLMRYAEGAIDLADAMVEMRDMLAHPTLPDPPTGDDINQAAANVDACLDSVALYIGQDDADPAQTAALVTAAQAAADTLLGLLGVPDPDDLDGERSARRTEARAGNPFAKDAADKPTTGKDAPITKGAFVKGPGVSGIGTVTSDPMMGTVSVKGDDGKVVDDVKTKALSVVSADDKKAADDKAKADAKRASDEIEARDALELVEGFGI